MWSVLNSLCQVGCTLIGYLLPDIRPRPKKVQLPVIQCFTVPAAGQSQMVPMKKKLTKVPKVKTIRVWEASSFEEKVMIKYLLNFQLYSSHALKLGMNSILSASVGGVLLRNCNSWEDQGPVRNWSLGKLWLLLTQRRYV
jgi:hypothetical protein